MGEKEMKRNSKRKLLLTTIVLVALLIFSAYAALIPNAQAAEVTIQEKGLLILNDVVGLDLSKYSIASREGPQKAYLSVVPQENVRYTLETDGSKVDLLCTFTNGKLRMIDVLESEGSPCLTEPTTSALEMTDGFFSDYRVLEMAKVFLSNSQSHSGNSFYGELESMLENVVANKNLTKTAGNVKMEVITSGDSATFRWTYTFNGVEAGDKCVVLGYNKGFLKYFIDNWDLYKIGSTSLNLSEEEAIKIAMESAEAYSWKVGSDNETYQVTKFNVTDVAVAQLVFCNSLNADKTRRQGLLTLYPMWRIGVALDKFYPGNVYGIYVDVWADTKEIRHIKEVFSTLDPPIDKIATLDESAVGPLDTQAFSEAQPNSISIPWIALPAFAAVMLGTVPIWLVKKKNLKKQRFFKINGILLCLLIALAMLLVPISAVNAAEPTRRATIWGAESTGMANRKTQAEILQQRSTSQRISDYFKNDGYDASNYQGSQGSFKTQILDQISTNEQNYDRVAVVDFDHGIGETRYSEAPGEFHYMFEDNIGMDPSDPYYFDHNYVYDMDIYERTNLGKTFFAFINTCMSANVSTYQLEIPQGSGQYYQVGQGFEYTTEAQGMPFGWTHGIKVFLDYDTTNPPSGYMSRNGYTHPDSGAYCYIGFPFGSASLSQQVDPDYPNKYYWMWVEDFFLYALSWDMSVIQALDHASYENFEWGFGDTALYKDFIAIWDPLPHYSGCKMVVYGNGDMHLYEYFVHSPYEDQGTYGSGTVSNPNGFTGAQPNGDYTHLRAVGVYDQAMVVGSMGYTGANEAHGHIYVRGYSAGGYTSRLRVYASYYKDQGWQCVSDNIVVSSGSGVHWIDCGVWSSNFRYISLVVYRESAGDNSCDLYLDSVLVRPSLPAPPSDDRQLTVLAQNQYGQPGYVPLYIDGQYVGTTGYTYTVTPENHQIYVASPLYGGGYHVFQYYYYDGNYDDDNPTTLSVTSDKTVTAYYYSYYY
jgi:hypothetical protein